MGLLFYGVVYQFSRPNATTAQGAETTYLPIVMRNFDLVYPFDWPNLEVEQLFQYGLGRPTQVTHAGDGSGRLFITEQPGRIRIVEGGQLLTRPFLDIRAIVEDGDYEQGLLSIVFPKNFAANRHFYVSYTDTDNNVRVVRYRVTPHDPNLADPNSAELILLVEQPSASHNGGQLQFGPEDGYLYVSLGDGENPSDPNEYAQDLSVLLGKILRIDVETEIFEGYMVPLDNPFVGTAGARPEIWSYGWRNPWRFSFDRQTLDMYVGDVGQNSWEELNWQPGDSTGGENYGWDCFEGYYWYEPAGCSPNPSDYIFPLKTYPHPYGCSVTGGYVYRGAEFPRMNGLYFYGDFCSGIVTMLVQTDAGYIYTQPSPWVVPNITSFGEDEAGELYFVARSGGLYRLVDGGP